MFPGFPFTGAPNILDANVPHPLNVFTAVPYTCSDPNFELVPPGATNMCDGQGNYGALPTCQNRK